VHSSVVDVTLCGGMLQRLTGGVAVDSRNAIYSMPLSPSLHCFLILRIFRIFRILHFMH
jgi:hypothetical protein